MIKGLGESTVQNAFVRDIAHCARLFVPLVPGFELCPLPGPCPPISTVVKDCILLCSIVEIITYSTLRLQSQQSLRYQTSCS